MIHTTKQCRRKQRHAELSAESFAGSPLTVRDVYEQMSGAEVAALETRGHVPKRLLGSLSQAQIDYLEFMRRG